MKEEWKKIEEVDGYEVSNFGNVRSIERKRICYKKNGPYELVFKGSDIKPRISRFGYYTVSLKLNQKCITRCVHRLVATAFLPNPENKPEVNHKDGDKFNNSLSNLEWVTISGNCIHASVTGLRKNPKLTIEQVRDIKFNPKYVSMMIKDIAKLFNVHSNTICSIRTSAKWKYVTEDPNDHMFSKKIVYKTTK